MLIQAEWDKVGVYFISVSVINNGNIIVWGTGLTSTNLHFAISFTTRRLVVCQEYGQSNCTAYLIANEAMKNSLGSIGCWLTNGNKVFTHQYDYIAIGF